MPTYEYRCSACGHEFEEIQSITSKPLIKCPTCGKSALKRLVTGGGGMIFKGNGFYQTDYKKKEGKTESASRPTSKKKNAETKDESAPVSPAPALSTGSKSDPPA